MRALERGLREQNAVVGEDRDRMAVHIREARDERRAVKGLELVEIRAVDEARDDLARIERLARIGRDDAVELVGRVEGLAPKRGETPVFTGGGRPRKTGAVPGCSPSEDLTRG